MLTFDDSKHEYRLDGVVIPSVTQILKAVGLSDYSHIPADVLQKAAERGTVVHEIIELYEKGTLDESTIDPALRGYFESYLRAKDAGLLPQKRPTAIERMVCSKALRYAGTLDQMYGEDWINDLKTGKPQPEHGIQLTAYRWALNTTIPPYRLTGTYLHEDGSIADVIDHRHNPGLWCSVLAVYKWKEKNGKLK